MSKFLTKSQSNILTFFVAFLEVFVIMPFLDTIPGCIILALIIFGGVLMFPDILYGKPFKYMLIFLVVAFSYALLGVGLNFKMLIFYGLFFLTAIIVCSKIIFLSKKQIYFLLYLLLGLLIFTFTETFLTLLTDNMAIRNNAYGAEDVYEAQKMGVYSYGFGEALSILLPGMTAFVLWSRQRLVQIISVVLIIAGLVTQFMASLATSALLSAFFCSIAVLTGFVVKRERIKIIVALIIFVVGLIIILPKFDLGENAAFLVKMEDISESYSSGQSVGQVGDRTSLYMQSLRVCVRNPLFGFGETPTDFGKYTPKTVSMHTALLDFWGMYGLFTLLLFGAWKGTVNSTFQLLNNAKRKTYRWAYVSLFFLLLLKGPVTIHTSFFISTVLLSIFVMADYYNSSDTVQKDV